MAIRFACRCGKKLKAPDEKIGRRVLCSACGNPVTVPEEDTVALPDVSSTAANLAGDLLKRSAENRDSEDDVEQGYNIGEIAAAIGKQVGPLVGGAVLLVVVVYWISSSVMTTAPVLPPLAEVEGIVTLNGVPLPGAQVTFQPRDGAKQDSKIAASFGRTDKNGYYSLQYTRDVSGAYIGEHIVSVSALDAQGKERVHKLYNSRSTEMKTVEDRSNEINIEVKPAR